MLIEQFYTNTGEVFTDSLGNEFFVLSIDIETAPTVIDAPGIKQRHNITPVVVSSGFPTIITPELGQDFKMAVSNVYTDTPEIQPPTLQQRHNIDSPTVSSGAITVSAPGIKQRHNITPVVIEKFYTSAGEVFKDSLGNEFFVLSADIETAPAVIDSPQLQQINKLISTDIITTSVPLIQIPQLHSVHNISVDLSLNSPTISRPILPNLGLYPATSDRVVEILEDIRLVVLT